MISNLFASFTSGVSRAAPYYLGVEALFYVAFHKYLVPRANEVVPPAPYRDYDQDRSKLLRRVTRRMEATCAPGEMQTTIHKFLGEWFHVAKNGQHQPNMTTIGKIIHQKFPNMAELSPSSSPDNSDDDDSTFVPAKSASATTAGSTDNEPPICLYKDDIDDFFAWAFFGKHHLTLLPWEVHELGNIYELLEQEHKLVFPPKPKCAQQLLSERYHISTPRCMSLEPVNAMHRPLLVYFIVGLLKVLGGLVLRFMGYQRLVASTGLVGWYRPGRSAQSEAVDSSSSSAFMPLLFFHGIAPSGLVLYLPMLLGGLATEADRPIFLFENRSISCSLDFHPLTEERTVNGVVEILERCQTLGKPLSIVGHSFGSCSITWLLASPRLRPYIQQAVLLDPVAILLSEPDVLVNFLYAQELDKIRMVASSELFTEYYLRRHFAWYNSELWLEDVPASTKLLVCLSEEDEIINARKVKQELERHASTQEEQPTMVYWKGVGHGHCIRSPSKWKQIKSLMLQQELEVFSQQQQRR